MQSAMVPGCALVLVSFALNACGSDHSSATDRSTTSGLSGASSSTSATSGDKATGSTVKVGVLVDAGGTAYSIPDGGQAAVAAADYANEYLNGLAGHRIDPVVCDTQTDPTVAANCANQFVQDGVVAVVTPTTGYAANAAPVISQAGIPWVVPEGASTQEYSLPNSFNLTGGLSGELGGTATYAKEHGITNVVALPLDAGTFVASVQAILAPDYKADGIALHVVPLPTDAPDYTPQITAALKFKPQAFLFLADTTTCTGALKAFVAVGASGRWWMNSNCTTPAAVTAVGAKYFANSVLFGLADSSGSDTDAVTYRKVMSQFAPKVSVNGDAEQGYQAMAALVRVVNASQSTGSQVTAGSVRAALNSSRNVTLPIGDGLAFTCDVTANPSVSKTRTCGEGTLAATLDSSAKISTYITLK